MIKENRKVLGWTEKRKAQNVIIARSKTERYCFEKLFYFFSISLKNLYNLL